MKKTLSMMLMVSMFLINTITFAQEVTLYTYKQVPNENLNELLEMETKYWSKVARKAIEDGKLTFWAVMVKRSVFDAPNKSNILYVNTFKDIDDTEGVWNPQAVFPDVPMEEMNTWDPKFGHIMHQVYVVSHAWQQAAHANPEEDFNYLWMWYHKTNNPSAFTDAERDHWGPFIKEIMDEKSTPQKGWGNARVLAPLGTELPFNSVSFDLYATMGDALLPEMVGSPYDKFPEAGQNALNEIERTDVNRTLYEIIAVESDN